MFYKGISLFRTNGNGEIDPDQSGGPDDIDCVTGKAFTLTPDAMGR